MPKPCPLCVTHCAHTLEECRRYHPPAYPDCPACCAYRLHTAAERAAHRLPAPAIAPGELLGRLAGSTSKAGAS